MYSLLPTSSLCSEFAWISHRDHVGVVLATSSTQISLPMHPDSSGSPSGLCTM